MGFIGMLSMPEMVMIFIVLLLLFGAKKLPELARGVGKAMGEFKKAREEFEKEITHAVKHAESEVITTKEPAATEPVEKQAVASPPDSGPPVDHGLH